MYSAFQMFLRARLVESALEKSFDEGLKRLHEAGKMHNRMACPTCREKRHRPSRMTTGKRWAANRV